MARIEEKVGREKMARREEKVYEERKWPEPEKKCTKREKTKTLFIRSLRSLPHKFRTSQEFRAEWRAWFKFRKEIGKELTPISIQRQITLLTNYDVPVAIRILSQSIFNGWRGLFRPVENSLPIQKPNKFKKIEVKTYRNEK